MTEADLIESVAVYVDNFRSWLLDTTVEYKLTEEQYDMLLELIGIETENAPCYCEIFED